MAAVHFTTIPFEPNTANYTYKSYISFFGGGGGEIRPYNSNIAYPKLFCAFL